MRSPGRGTRGDPASNAREPPPAQRAWRDARRTILRMSGRPGRRTRRAWLESGSSFEPVFACDLREAIARGGDGGESGPVSPREDGERADGGCEVVPLILHHEAVTLWSEEGKALLVRAGKGGVLGAVQHAERRAESAHPALDELQVPHLAPEVELERREEAVPGVVPLGVGVHHAEASVGRRRKERGIPHGLIKRELVDAAAREAQVGTLPGRAPCVEECLGAPEDRERVLLVDPVSY